MLCPLMMVGKAISHLMKRQKCNYTLVFNLKLEYYFTREKEIVCAQQQQSVPKSINDFVEMTIFLCLICFSIYPKMQGF